MNREDILKALIDEQNNQITTLQNAVNEFKTASDLDESEARDIEDLSHQDESKDMQLRYEKILADAQNNLLTIQNITENQHDNTETGSIIETDENFFLVGISLPKISINGKDAMGIAEDAPIFSQLQGKKAGDTFKLGDKETKIIRIL